ncbi:MAG: hypothetical protein ACREU3_04465 [Steroidobacteraceae bacterium]
MKRRSSPARRHRRSLALDAAVNRKRGGIRLGAPGSPYSAEFANWRTD